MISPEISTVLTVIFYATAILGGIIGTLFHNEAIKTSGYVLSIAGLLFQTLLLITGFHKTYPGGLSSGAYIQLVAWFIMLCGVIIYLRIRQKSILLFATTLALMLFLISSPLLWSKVKLPDGLEFSFYALHIGSLFLSLALLALAFITALIFLVLEKKIKSKLSVSDFWRDMPALALLDKINSICILIAFPLYTIGIFTGLLWSSPIYGEIKLNDPKEITSIAIWIFFALLFHNRFAKGWKGKKPARLTILLFFLCIFSVLTVNMMMNSHHSFIRG